MIRTENLTKIYGGVKAVDDLTITVARGEVFGFVGPNGSGKTTTIGMLVGLIEPSGGKCFIDDIDVTHKPLEAKKITGYLPDGIGFYPAMTARQNLKYFSKFYGMGDRDADARISELLDYVGLGGVEKPTGDFSRGMRQRLGLAQALLNDPQVIFMDEPTNGLDPQGVVTYRHIIKDLAVKGKTIFFSSHILEDVRQVSTVIGVISQGRIVAQGTTDAVRREMLKDDLTTIVVRVRGEMPKLSLAQIVSADYRDGTAVLRTQGDVRDAISDELFQRGVHVRELRVEERSLEDVFLETVYGGASS
ncbi:MAG TPA: ABC transporter ATP-binding protein [Methanocella sp.]|nr:ABC transporter ATP-binding protein [Methanocella sp.]